MKRSVAAVVGDCCRCLCAYLVLTHIACPAPRTQAQQLRAKIVTQDTYDLAGYKQLLDDLRGLSASQDVCSAYEELVAAFPTAVSVESSSSSSSGALAEQSPPLGRPAARRCRLSSVPVLTPAPAVCILIMPPHCVCVLCCAGHHMEPLRGGADGSRRDGHRQDGVWALPDAVPLCGPVVHVPQVHQKGGSANPTYTD